MNTLNFKPNKKGYVLNHYCEIEKLTYSEYLRQFGGDETTTPNGVAPRHHVRGKKLCTWGARGNNFKVVQKFETKKEAKKELLLIWENNVSEASEYRYFATSKKDLYHYLAESFDKPKKVIKRYFKIQQAEAEKLRLSKIKHDNRPIFTKEMMVNYIECNKEMIESSLKELDAFKASGDKEAWQVKANSLVQKVSNNDFRVLKWKDIYNLIRTTLN